MLKKTRRYNIYGILCTDKPIKNLWMRSASRTGKKNYLTKDINIYMGMKMNAIGVGLKPTKSV